MGTHIGATPKQIADDIAKASNKTYTTYVKNGIKRYVWSYTSDGTFKTPNYGPTCDILVVAGGGGGGAWNNRSGGGGGAGGYRTASGHTVTPQGYTVVVGSGGAGGDQTSGTKGSDSVFDTITATGGGNPVSYTHLTLPTNREV